MGSQREIQCTDTRDLYGLYKRVFWGYRHGVYQRLTLRRVRRHEGCWCVELSKHSFFEGGGLLYVPDSQPVGHTYERSKCTSIFLKGLPTWINSTVGPQVYGKKWTKSHVAESTSQRKSRRVPWTMPLSRRHPRQVFMKDPEDPNGPIVLLDLSETNFFPRYALFVAEATGKADANFVEKLSSTLDYKDTSV